MAVGEAGGKVRLFEYPSGVELEPYSDSQGLAFASAYVASRDSYIVYYQNGVVEERDAVSFELINAHVIDNGVVEFFGIDKETGFGFFHDFNGNSVLYDPFSGEIVKLIPSSEEEVVVSARIQSLNEETVLALGYVRYMDGVSRFWIEIQPLSEENSVFSVDTGMSEVRRYEFSLVSERLVYSVYNGNYWDPVSEVYLYNTQTGLEVKAFTINADVDGFAFSGENSMLYVLCHDDSSQLEIRRYDSSSGEFLDVLPFLSNEAAERSRPWGNISLLPGELKAIVSTAQGELYIVDLVEGEVLGQGFARPDTPGVSSTFDVLRYISVSRDGNRFLFQDSQGMVDSWIFAEVEPVPVTSFVATNGLGIEFEGLEDYEYLIEKSRDLRVWQKVDTLNFDEPEHVEIELPISSEISVFGRVSRWESK